MWYKVLRFGDLMVGVVLNWGTFRLDLYVGWKEEEVRIEFGLAEYPEGVSIRRA